MISRKLKGFGLIELIIVFSIIVIGTSFVVSIGKNINNKLIYNQCQIEYQLLKMEDSDKELQYLQKKNNNITPKETNNPLIKTYLEELQKNEKSS